METLKIHLILVASIASSIFAADVNVLWINDKDNMVAKDAITGSMDYLKANPAMGVNVANTEVIEADETDLYKAVENVCGSLEKMIDAGNPPDVIVDSTRAGTTSEVVKSLSLTLGIPTVSMSYGEAGDIREWKDLTNAQAEYLVQVRPPADLLTDVIREIILQQNITNAAILFDDTFVMDHKYKSLLQNIPVRHIIIKVKDGDAEIKKQLNRMSDVDLNNFFIFGSKMSIEKVMRIANGMKMYGNKYAWFAITKELTPDFMCDCKDVDVIFMNPIASKTGNIKTLQRTYNLNGIPQIDTAFYFDVAARGLTAVSNSKDAGSWPSITYTKCNDYTETTPIARDNIPLRTTMKSVNMADAFGPMMITTNGNSYMQFDVNINKIMFRNSKTSKIMDIGDWKAGMTDNIKYKTGASLSGFAATTIYKVVTVIQPPFVMKTMENGKAVYKGYCIDLINELKALMNFEYEIFEAEDGQYGSMNENMEWNGMVKELLEKKADIALGALSVMAERENVIDFTVPYYDLVGIIIMMKKPKIPTSLFKFLSVLEDSVWGCILAAYFATSVLMWIFDKFSPYSYQNNIEKYEDDDEKRYFNLKECLWFCLTSLTPQGGGEAPKNLSGRLVAATWWLFGFIIIASYTANLAAFLTVSRLETPVESLEDLSKQYKIQYAPMNGSATMTYFERMAYIEEKFYEIWKDMSLNDSLSDLERAKLAVWDYPVSDKYTKMWQSMKEATLPANFEDALERVRASKTSSEGFAFLGDATDIRYQVLTNCDLQMVGEEFSRKPYALAVQQGSPLKDQFNDAILKLLNQRKLETLKERWWNQNPEKKNCDDEDDTGGGISIYNIGGVFIVIFVGIGLAIVTLVFEYWYYKYKKPQSRVESGDSHAKQLNVKQFGGADKTDFTTEYKSGGVAPVGNPW